MAPSQKLLLALLLSCLLITAAFAAGNEAQRLAKVAGQFKAKNRDFRLQPRPVHTNQCQNICNFAVRKSAANHGWNCLVPIAIWPGWSILTGGKKFSDLPIIDRNSSWFSAITTFMSMRWISEGKRWESMRSLSTSWSPVTYAGAVTSLEDLDLNRNAGLLALLSTYLEAMFHIAMS
ncbi:hypothetical protein SELMODRAFT_424951 [Selaginella moellendorffii]|uniref:Uncharacterized protein n=1 Tax=Selaginella moellendorffii TaxID=88036 RepID=D8SRI5_SELML|nr:hypothetical protein SELMODRAFT_424951 [Selaginella moellendorffii]